MQNWTLIENDVIICINVKLFIMYCKIMLLCYNLLNRTIVRITCKEALMKNNKKENLGVLFVKEDGQAIYKKNNCIQIRKTSLSEIKEKNKVEYITKGGNGL